MAAATTLLSGQDLAGRIGAAVPDAIEETDEAWVCLRPETLLDVARFVRDDPALDGRYLTSLTGLDRLDYFEVAYNVVSLSHNHGFLLKVAADHESPEVPSVVSVWLGAHLQEREAFDLLGIRFAGHPEMKRIFLWEGFPGHPLRKDFLEMPGGFHPGLSRFPNEEPEAWGGEFRGN